MFTGKANAVFETEFRILARCIRTYNRVTVFSKCNSPHSATPKKQTQTHAVQRELLIKMINLMV